MRYHQLALTDRYQIEALRQTGESIRRMAAILERAPSSISRELRRNRGRIYRADRAERRAIRLKKALRPDLKRLQGHLENQVRKKLKMDWSPVQIEANLKSEGVKVSYSTIYRYVYREAVFCPGDPLFIHLRTGRRSRVKRRKTKPAFYDKSKQKFIDQRPNKVNQRKRIGDFERDTIRGKGNKPSIILTVIDRTTRKLFLAHLPDRTCQSVHEATVKLLKGEIVRTITNDNGAEFTDYAKTETALKTQIYFSHPRACWERGSNENANGLLRQYFKKDRVFKDINSNEVLRAERLLNNRPRKCLDFQTPNEVHQRLSRRCT